MFGCMVGDVERRILATLLAKPLRTSFAELAVVLKKMYDGVPRGCLEILDEEEVGAEDCESIR